MRSRGRRLGVLLCAAWLSASVAKAGAQTPAAAVAPAAAGPATGTASAPAELMRRIDAAQADLRTLAAEFVQTSRIKLFKQQIRSQGRLLYQRGTPTKLRWEYTKPDPSTMLLIGDRATLRIGTRPPQVFDSARDPTLHAIFTQLQLWLGNGSLAAAQGEYEIRSSGPPEQPALLLMPKPSSVLSRAFARIELHVDGRTLQLVRLLLIENSGDEKEIAFSRLQRNSALPANAFD